MTEKEMVRRYHWFCTVGYRKPVLNDPVAIQGEASPDYIDQLIQEGMKRWPIRHEPYSPEPILPRCA